MTVTPGPNQDNTQDTTVTPVVGEMLTMISEALNSLGDTTAQPDPRIAPAAALLSKINSEWATSPGQAAYDASMLASQINALWASHPRDSRLADAVDAAEQLAGTWSGDDYV